MSMTNPTLPRRKRILSITAAFSILWAIATAAAPAVSLGAATTPGGSTGPGPGPGGKLLATVPLLPTILTIEVPSGSVIGSDVAIGVLLRTKTGIALSEHVSLSLDGAQVRSDKTDTTGKVSLVIPAKDLIEARAYAIQVVFAGARGLAPATANGTLTVLAAAIQFDTVPALPNIRFSLGTESAVTGPDGVAALPVPKAGAYQLTVDLNPDTSATATVKASFVRWLDNVYTANRTINVTGPATFTMGLRVAYRASIKYVDLQDKPVDPALVDQAQFSTGTGADNIVLNSQVGVDQVWWEAASAVRYSTQLQSSAVTYRALSVKIHGADVVNRGQQSWTPTENGVWTIQLLLYSLTVQTRDALFGTPVGGTLSLTYPDGLTIQQPVDGDGRVSFVNLPRGQYKLSLRPVAISAPTPVALSKAQESTVRVVTYLDVGVVLGGLLIFGAIMVGRWVILSRRLKRRARRPVGVTTA
jgi:hypothetical protein